MPDVEEGVVILVGATTQNPFFAINSALVSRSRVFQFEPLSTDDIKTLIRRALADRERGLGQYEVRMHDDALEFLAEVSDGDARRALSALEVGVLSSERAARSSSRARWPRNRCSARRSSTTRTGDAHYDAISALIKSMRGSDPDAAIYWLARMLEAGEDVRFLARRIVIFASEDVGNADPQALPLAVAAMQACEFVGLPECQLNLAQAVTYMACAPKSNASMVALAEATAGRARGPAAAGAGHPARQPLSGGQATGARPGLSICARQPRRDRGAGLSGRRARVLSSGRPRLRTRAGRAAGDDPRAAARSEEPEAGIASRGNPPCREAVTADSRRARRLTSQLDIVRMLARS